MQGINTICLGRVEGRDTLFRGFGIPDSTELELRAELAPAYNARPTNPRVRASDLGDHHVTPDAIPGPMFDRVRRPARTALETR
ncbi:MAG: hypothetical protein IPL61_25790 [Myxococcales bacterium]|nr:hypothetical protein [Myxococcales bacterium]